MMSEDAYDFIIQDLTADARVAASSYDSQMFERSLIAFIADGITRLVTCGEARTSDSDGLETAE